MRITRCAFLLAVLLPLGAFPSGAGSILEPEEDHGHPWCGTKPERWPEELAKHTYNQRRLEGDRSEGKALRSVPAAVAVGDVAAITDDGSIVVTPNQLDIAEFGMEYQPQKKGGYVAAESGEPVSDALGDRIELSDDDARAVAFPKGFKFRFYNKPYSTMFVHSDGTISFVEPDAASTGRDLGRLIGGPPRIAPLFADLNPETAGGVYVSTSKTKIVVTWFDLPVFGTTNHNTFQVVLYPSKGNVNGRITFAFGRIDAREAVVGIAPGNAGRVLIVDYRGELPTGVISAGIVERFATTTDVDHLAIAKAFFSEFKDDYDHLVVFLDFSASLGGRAFAFELTVKNEIKGIGLNVFDFTKEVGSKGRLRSFLQMGSLSRYPSNPDQTFLGTNSTLDVLGQEGGHRWLAFLRFIDENGEPSDALLGRDLAHWSFCHNSLASDMEGNELREDGGDRFTSIAATARFSPLDQYAMGLIAPGDVAPFFYVDPCPNPSEAPEVGAGLIGRRIEVSIDQVVAAEGPRVPHASKAPHTFNMAFIVVGEAGVGPSDAAIAKVDTIRAAWEPYFAEATDGHGTVSTALKLKSAR